MTGLRRKGRASHATPSERLRAIPEAKRPGHERLIEEFDQSIRFPVHTEPAVSKSRPHAARVFD